MDNICRLRSKGFKVKDPGKSKIKAFNCPNCGAAVAPEATSCAYCRSAIAARICPSCFGAVAVGMKYCPSCGAAVKSAPPDKTTSLRCPRCECDLFLVCVGKNALHECLQCGGLWVRNESFQDICTRQEDHHPDTKQSPSHLM